MLSKGKERSRMRNPWWPLSKYVKHCNIPCVRQRWDIITTENKLLQKNYFSEMVAVSLYLIKRWKTNFECLIVSVATCSWASVWSTSNNSPRKSWSDCHATVQFTFAEVTSEFSAHHPHLTSCLGNKLTQIFNWIIIANSVAI